MRFHTASLQQFRVRGCARGVLQSAGCILAVRWTERQHFGCSAAGARSVCGCGIPRSGCPPHFRFSRARSSFHLL